MVRLSMILAAACMVAAGAAVSAESAGTQVVVSGQDERRDLALTVYNSDLALVRETRELTLPAGLVRVEFRDVPAAIDPTSLGIDGGPDLVLLEQNYEFDLLTRQRILEKYVGRELAWIQEDGSTIAGTLLGMQDGPTFLVDGRIVFEVPGRLALPELPTSLRDRPTLVWLVDGSGGRREVEASYLTGGVSWKADYVLELDTAGRLGDLQAWVTLENRSGASFRAAQLRLVAGDVNRVGPPIRELMTRFDAAPAAAKGFQEESLFDYHLYTLARPTDILDRQIKQVSLFTAQNVPVTRHYRVLPGRLSAREGDRVPVEVSYVLANDAAGGLGLPFPAGTVRVYGQSDAGLQFLGEDRVEHTPTGEAVDVTVGQAFDIVAERTVVSSERLGDRGERRTVRVVLRNRKTEDVQVEVAEAVHGYWRVTASTLPVRRVNAGELAFDVDVKAGAETAITYTVEIDR